MQHVDVRAAAAWSLGEIGQAENIDALIASFAALEPEVRIEAARALAKLAQDFRAAVVSEFAPTSHEQRPGIAWALGKSGVTNHGVAFQHLSMMMLANGSLT